jgi:predicted nucleic acid-binding Zn ribbon protein
MELPLAKLRCRKCHSRLDVMETASGARTISVTFLGPSVEQSAQALEVFQGPDAGPELLCPACGATIDPSEPYARFRP